MQQRGARAGGRSEERDVDAHDHHDDGKLGRNIHACTVAVDDGHQGDARCAVVHELREDRSEKAHAQCEYQRRFVSEEGCYQCHEELGDPAFVVGHGMGKGHHHGEDEDDPVLYITDLLIHLAGQQMAKKASEAVEGEKLDILIGSQPLKDLPDDKKKEAVKENVLRILNEKYGVEEEDFLSAELEIVPAGKARDCGLDRSMIAGYGQDDRVCAYTSLLALLEMEAPKRTSCCLLVDKEEIGSVGATGMQSHFFENSVAEVLDAMGQYSDLRLRKALKNSSMLSSDVSAGYDPAFAEAFEKKNSAYLGRGIVLNKFTGARGKSGSNDANAEYVAHIRAIMEESGVAFQTAELGKIDVGGGGTIAYILALYGMNVIDCGVAVLSMHAPWEATSKADIYETKCGYVAFLEKPCL